MADEGFGVSVSFASGFCAEILSVAWDGMERKELDTSHAGTSGGDMTFLPSDLNNPGELTVELLFNPAVAPPRKSAPETVTVTHPVPAGGSTASTWSASGFMKSFKNVVPHDDLMKATGVIKFSGPITITPGS